MLPYNSPHERTRGVQAIYIQSIAEHIIHSEKQRGNRQSGTYKAIVDRSYVSIPLLKTNVLVLDVKAFLEMSVQAQPKPTFP